jgi:hypothetical protein
MGVDELKGTTTPASISALDHTFVWVDKITLPAKIGVAEFAATVGSVFGTPGELLTCVTERRLCRQEWMMRK